MRLGKHPLGRVAFWALTGVVLLGPAIQKSYAQTGGPPGGAVRALAIDPSTPTTVYAGVYYGGGVFKSTNGGTSWTAVNSGLPNTYINTLAIDPFTPATLYAGTSSRGVFKSTNGGTSWTAVPGLTDSNVNALAIDPSTPATLYAGTYYGGVCKSTNGGTSWTAANSGLTNTHVYALAIDPSVPATLYAGTWGGGVFKSTDGGSTWAAVNSGLTDMYLQALAIDPSTPATLYAGTQNGGVFKSTNGAASWTAVNSGLTSTGVLALAIDPSAPATLYAGGGGVFKSTNGGTSWTAVKSGLTYTGVYAVAIDPSTPATLYAGTWGGGVFKSTNGGASWTAANSGLTGPYVTALAIDPSTPATLYAGTSGGGVFKSTNGGTSWTAVNSGLTNTQVNALAIDPSTPATLYAGTNGGGVFKSTNAGTSWTAVNSGLTNTYVFALAIDPSAPATLYAGTIGGGVFKSTNGGASWTAVNSGLTDTLLMVLAIDPSTPATLYAGTYYGVVFKSTNGGTSWTTVNSGLTVHDRYVEALAIDPSTPATLYAGFRFCGVFKSTDGGTSWQPTGASYGDGTPPATAISMVSGNNQTGGAGQPLRYPLVVVVTNASGIPVAGVTVNFAVTAGGGTLWGTQSTTDSQGVAYTTLTLGPTPGTNTVTATASGLTAVTFTALTPTAPALAVDPTSISFSASGTIPVSRILSVSSTSSAVRVSASAATTSGGAWLSVNPAAATTPAALNVSANPSGLSPGTYRGTITIASAGASNNPQNIEVTFTVVAPVSLSLSRSSLSFNYEMGAAPPVAQSILASSSGAPLSLTASAVATSGGNWLSVTATSGGSTPANISVAVNPAGLTPGVYSGVVSVSSPGASNSPRRIDVRLMVTAGSCAVSCPAVAPVTARLGDIVPFSASVQSFACSGSPTYNWEFGDGSAPVIVADARHIYSQLGTYTWTFTASINASAVCTRAGKITIQPPLLSLVALEVTQGIQNLKNQVALVEGRQTYIRAYVESDREWRNAPVDRVRLTATRIAPDGSRTKLGELDPETSVTLPTALSRGLDDRSFNFRLDGQRAADWAKGTVEFRFDSTDPIVLPVECAEPAEQSGTAGDCRVVLSFTPSPPARVRFVGIVWKDGDKEYKPSADDVAAVVHSIETTFPIPHLDWDYLYDIKPLIFAGPPSGTVDFVRLDAMLLENRAIDCVKQAFSGGCNRYYLGIVVDPRDPPATRRWDGMAITSLFKGTGNAAAFYAYTTKGVTSNTPPHELAHLAGRKHVNCSGTEANPDAKYPYNKGVIGGNHDFATDIQAARLPETFYGFDVYAGPGESRVYGPATADLMSYCFPNWPSDYTYNAIREELASRFRAASSTDLMKANSSPENVSAQLPPSTVLIIDGEASNVGTGKLNSIYAAASGAIPPAPAPGSFTIRFDGASGQALAAFDFEPEKSPDDPSTGRFVLTLPAVADTRRLVLLWNGQVLDSREASTNAPGVTVTYPNGGEILDGETATVTWTASDADGDALKYSLQYSSDGGSTWTTLITDWTQTAYTLNLKTVPGSNEALLRVLTTDGFWTAQDDSDATFTVARNVPAATIRTPAAGTAFSGMDSVTLNGSGYDSEDGQLADSALTWASDINGPLGTGRSLTLNAWTLAAGNHSITLTAKDSDGMTRTAQVNITIQCAYSLSQSNASYDWGPGQGSVQVVAPAGCPRTAASSAGWVTIGQGASGSGVGLVTYSVAENNSGVSRAATLTIGGQTLTITQAWITCNYSLSAASASATAAGGTGSFDVSTTGADCGWAPAANAGWISIATGADAKGDGTLNYTVTPNYTTSTRAGTITIGNQSFTITQAAASTIGYLVGDVFPMVSASGDLNGDGDTVDAGEFGDNQLTILDLIYALRAVTSVPGYRPRACSDRFDAIDSFPKDTDTARGGDGILNTVDLIYTLRRVTNVDTSRPQRTSRGLACPAQAPGQQAVPLAHRPSSVLTASIEFGDAIPADDSLARVPVFLGAAGEASFAGLSMAFGMVGGGRLRFLPAEGVPAPSLVDDELPGVLALAWLEGMRMPASRAVLLGYLEIPGAQATVSPQLYGVSANTSDGGEVQVMLGRTSW